MIYTKTARCLSLLLTFLLLSSASFAATKKKHRASSGKSARVTAGKSTARKSMGRHARARGRKSATAAARRHVIRTHQSRLTQPWTPWKEPTFADSTAGDYIDGEDLTVRRAAVEALGPFNGTVVAVDPTNGRILSMVNQKLALKSGFEPCSTIKIVAALAGLNEGIVSNGMVARMGRSRMTLTEALAHSNNYYFASVGEALGFERIIKYGQLMGLGERATLDVPNEEPGRLPSAPPRGGLGMMTSFGEGIKLTPLELASIMMTVSNGGKMYYLQYPRSQEEVARFTPRMKREIDFAHWIPEIKPGMSGAVEFGTARRASYDQTETILGKTGTCTDENSPTHLGWFGSFNESGKKKIVVVVLLTGGRPVNGPVASGIAGQVYRNLAKAGYFQGGGASATPVALMSTGECCALNASSIDTEQ